MVFALDCRQWGSSLARARPKAQSCRARLLGIRRFGFLQHAFGANYAFAPTGQRRTGWWQRIKLSGGIAAAGSWVKLSPDENLLSADTYADQWLFGIGFPPCFGRFCCTFGAFFEGHFGGCSLSTFLHFAAMHCKCDAAYMLMTQNELCENLRGIAMPCKVVKY